MVSNRKGFTLIELVIIIVILGILAAVAVPKYIDLQDSAEEAAIRGLYGSVVSAYGITIGQLKKNPTAGELNANLSGDTGSLTMNAATTVAVAEGANTILGGKKKGTFTVTVAGAGSPITAISGLTIAAAP